MSGFPNLPPPGPTSSQPGAPADGLGTIDTGPAADPAPARESQPAQVPFLHSANEDGLIMSEQQYAQDLLRETNTLPKVVLGLSVVLTLGIYGTYGMMAGGAAAAIGSVLFGGIVMVVASVIAICAAWAVAKIFADDYGPAWGLILRFSAVATAQFPIFELMSMVLSDNRIFAFFLAVPVVFGVVMVVGGLNPIRAFVFMLIMGLINWILIAFVAANLGVLLASR